ncbi:MAG TPA: DedA family protein [Thermoplasmata archaeon]|nr:DedA family protein [Thermoplasmata archaeon]
MTFSLIQSLVNLTTTVLADIGLPGLFALMVIESIGVPPLPSEVILPFSGFLVAEGVFGFVPAVAVAVAGGMVGAYIAYAIGRWGRHRIADLGIGRLRLDHDHLERMDRFFARRGEITVGLARLVPVVRAYVSYPAGTARMEPARFGVFTFLGSLPFAIGLIYAGVELRSHWGIVAAELGLLDDALIVVLVLVVLYLGLVALGVLRPKFLTGGAPSPPGSTPPEPPGPPKA